MSQVMDKETFLSKTKKAPKKPKLICSVCNIGERPVDEKACFSCTFWGQWYQDRDEPNVVRAGGHHYVFFTGLEPVGVKGMSGRKYRVEFKDGRKIKTDDLWHQGEIPLLWQGLGLDDNAKLVEL